MTSRTRSLTAAGGPLGGQYPDAHDPLGVRRVLLCMTLAGLVRAYRMGGGMAFAAGSGLRPPYWRRGMNR